MSNTELDKIAAQLGYRISMKVTGDLKSASASFVKLNSSAANLAQDGSVR
ncbi:Uncharacterised protein [Mycobacteroides abscessus subsp. abscessus]|nr:hypothetical protein [Mycobacteroides abscessus]SLI19213.1 Uncharacterised protein [Mycobacteroides abscessus subsp. abscessus]